MSDMSHFTPTKSQILVSLGIVVALAIAPLGVVQAHENDQGKDKTDAGSDKTITGEVVDLMCYIDHGAAGEKHAGCAGKCIKGGGPVGIVSDGKSYLIVGEHKPINDQLAEFAGKTVTVKGKLAERGGMAMIENAEVVKQ